jgi:hypothetical protein
MKKQYLVILLVVFVGLKMQAQTNVSMPADTTVHIGLNTYVQPVSFTADNNAQQQEYLHYLRNAKTLKILGWTSLGLGIPTMGIGFLLGVSGVLSDSKGDGLTKSAGLIFASGAVLTLSSIPLFIVSHHYKTKGNKLKVVSVSLGSQQVFIPQGNRFVSGVQPALSVKVAL